MLTPSEIEAYRDGLHATLASSANVDHQDLQRTARNLATIGHGIGGMVDVRRPPSSARHTNARVRACKQPISVPCIRIVTPFFISSMAHSAMRWRLFSADILRCLETASLPGTPSSVACRRRLAPAREQTRLTLCRQHPRVFAAVSSLWNATFAAPTSDLYANHFAPFDARAGACPQSTPVSTQSTPCEYSEYPCEYSEYANYFAPFDARASACVRACAARSIRPAI